MSQNPFPAKEQAVATMSTGAVASYAREEHELQSLFTVAHRLGRDERSAWDSIMIACERPGFALQPNGDPRALYVYERGGKTISGCSVYMARELLRHWTGLVVDSPRIVDEGEGWIHIRAVVIDLIRLNRHAMEDRFRLLVQRRDKEDNTTWVVPDERNRRELINRRAAILERNCILKMIPADVVDSATEKVQEVMDAESSADLQAKKAETIAKMLEMFGLLKPIEVSSTMIEKYLGRPLDQITPTQLTSLRGIYKSVVDGHTDVADHFPVSAARQSEATQRLNEELAKQKAQPAAAPPAPVTVPLGDPPPQTPTAQSAAPQPATNHSIGIAAADLVQAIEKMEVALGLTPKKWTDPRITYAGNINLGTCAEERLRAYFNYLSDLAGQSA